MAAPRLTSSAAPRGGASALRAAGQAPTGRSGSGTPDGAALALVLAALAWLGGTALQLQQPALWPAPVPAALLAAAVLLGLLAWWARGRRGRVLLIVALVSASFALTAMRAQSRLAEALAPALEGQDLVLTGIVAQLPRRQPDGVRFVFEVEHATQQGRAVAVPSLVSLGWYRGWQGGGEGDGALLYAPYEGIAAGQRWRFPVRLATPHGSLNPHGFDHELWLFEQGVRAVGTVRASEAAPAQRLASAAGAPVERTRQWARDAIERRVTDPRAAGVLAALAVGDQAAIELGIDN